jgi:CcmD family protein
MEEMNLRFIVAAYSVSWLVILGYLVRLRRKESSARAGFGRMTHNGEAGR